MRGSAVGNGLLNGAASLVTAISGVLISVLVVRELSTTEFGRYTYYLWLSGILLVLGTLAFPSSLTKIASELRGRGQPDQAAALVRFVALALLAMNLLIGLVVAGIALAAPQPARDLLLLVAFNPLLGALTSLMQSAHWSRQRFVYPMLAGVCGSAAQLGLVALAVAQDWQIPGFLAAALALNLAQVLVLGVPLLPRVPRLLRGAWPSRSTLSYLWLFALPLTLHTLFDAVVWQNSGIFFLENLSNREQVGFYGLAFTTFALFLNLGRALVFGYYPAISADFGAGAWERIRHKVGQGTVMGVLFAVPVSFGGLACLGALMHLLYGEKMDPAVPVAMALFVGMAPGVMAATFGATVTAINRPWTTILIALGVTVLTVVLCLALVPLLGALGAALSNLIAQSVYAFAMYWVVRRLTQARLPWGTLGAIVAVGAVTTYALPWLALAVFGEGLAGLAAAVAVGGLSYVLAVRGLGLLKPLFAESLRVERAL